MTLLPEPSAERNLETLKVSVSYTYHETPETEECETINKRVNLATFLVYAVAESGANIEFDILFTREKPSAEKLYETLGLRAKSSAALTISRIMEGEYKNVKLSQGATERSDLCHHQRVFRRSAEKSGTKYHFVFALNDGVRGPFVDKKVAQATRENIPFQGVPLWLVKFLERSAAHRSVRLVSPILSCQQDLHLQTYAFLMSTSDTEESLTLLQGTCVEEMQHDMAIVLGEIGLSLGLLDHGMLLASFYPEVVVSRYDRAAIRDGLSSLSEGSLINCANPLTSPSLARNVETLSNLVFVKYGGDILRANLLPQSYLDKVHEETIALWKANLDRPLLWPWSKSTLTGRCGAFHPFKK